MTDKEYKKVRTQIIKDITTEWWWRIYWRANRRALEEFT